MLRTGAACAGVTAVADGTAAVCGRGASAQATSVQIAQAPNPESRPQRLIAHPPRCPRWRVQYILYYKYHYIVNGNRLIGVSKKAPLSAGLE